MSPLLFTVVFQGLAVWALCCLTTALLDFFPLKNNPLQKLLNHITFPIFKVTEIVTPTLIPKYFYMFLAAVWLLVARVGFYLVTAAYGWLPMVTS
jgi:hypothetical protein